MSFENRPAVQYSPHTDRGGYVTGEGTEYDVRHFVLGLDNTPRRFEALSRMFRGFSYMGDLSLADRAFFLSIGGSRNNSTPSARITQQVIESTWEICAAENVGLCVFTGFYRGIDTVALQVARELCRRSASSDVRYGGAVSTPLPHLFPAENVSLARDAVADQGLIVSAVLHEIVDQRESAQALAQRNWITGCGDYNLVIEAREDSGSANLLRGAQDAGMPAGVISNETGGFNRGMLNATLRAHEKGVYPHGQFEPDLSQVDLVDSTHLHQIETAVRAFTSLHR